ncbi:transposable element Tcb2 transposase [Trichonephila clavipes]|nr:transposable element Tcb2 transposase [Trichonephila clavipes]
MPVQPSEMTLITFLENCARTAVTSSRDRLEVLVPSFKNIWYSGLSETLSRYMSTKLSWRLSTGCFASCDHLIGTSAQAPQRPMVMTTKHNKFYMTAQRYVHNILQPRVLPLVERLPGAIFQQDNALPHTERMSQVCIRPVTTLLWLARSPDLSLIEHI